MSRMGLAGSRGALLLGWLFACSACKDASLLSGKLCDQEGRCLAGYVCQPDSNRCVPEAEFDGGGEDDGGADADAGTDGGDSTDGGVLACGLQSQWPSCEGFVPFDRDAIYDCDLVVDPQSQSDDPDGSWDKPFATISAVARAARPGCRILLVPGEHPGDQQVVDLHGQPGKPVLITSANNQQPAVVRGGEFALHLENVSYVVIERLRLTGARASGLWIDDGLAYPDQRAHHVVVRELNIDNIGLSGNRACLRLAGLDEFAVRENEFSNCGSTGIGVEMTGCHCGHLGYNTLTGEIRKGMEIRGGSSQVVLWNNDFQRVTDQAINLGGISTLDSFRPLGAEYEAQDVAAVSNRVVGSQTPISFIGCTRCAAINNTVIFPTKWALRLLQANPDLELPGGDDEFINNLVVLDLDDLIQVFDVGPDTRPESMIFANNLWFDPTYDELTAGDLDLPVEESGGVVGENPLLRDLDAGDHRPVTGSPACGAGLSRVHPLLDRDGLCHPIPPDVGAYICR